MPAEKPPQLLIVRLVVAPQDDAFRLTYILTMPLSQILHIRQSATTLKVVSSSPSYAIVVPLSAASCPLAQGSIKKGLPVSSTALYVRATRCNVVDSCLSGRPSISPTIFVYVMVAYITIICFAGNFLR